MKNHPLKDPKSTHYHIKRDDVLQHARDSRLFNEFDLYRARILPKECEMIDILEALLTREQLLGFALGNFLKYARNKGQDEEDEMKAIRYRDYAEFLA